MSASTGSKRILSVLLSIVMIITMFGICDFYSIEKSASAENVSVMLNGFDNATDMGKVNSIHCATTSLCTTDYFGGTGSLLLSVPSTYPDYINPYHTFFNVEWGNPFNLVAPGTFDYVEICTKNVDNPGYNFGYQLIAMHGDSVGVTYNEGASAANCDWKRHTWSTGSGDIAGDTSQINRFRPVILNQNGRYLDIDFLVDGLAVFNADYYNERTNVETSIHNDINSLPTPTAANAVQVLERVNAMIANYESCKSSYINFSVDNYNDLITTRNKCQSFIGNALLVNGFDTTADFNSVSKNLSINPGTLGINAMHCSRGASVFVDTAPQFPEYSTVKPFYYYFDVELPQPVDVTQFSKIELCFKTAATFTGSNYQLQVRAIDKSINPSAGINYLTTFDSKAGEWKKVSFAVSNGTAEVAQTSLKKIDRIRIVAINYDDTYKEMDTHFDSLALCDDKYIADRTAAENEIAKEINAVEIPNQANFRDLEPDILALRKKYEAAEAQWIGFMPSNANRYITMTYNYDIFANKATYKNAFTMPSNFSDCMLFNQNDPMNLWGTSAIGRNVMKAELYKNNSLVETVTDYSFYNGNWNLAFSPRKGSFDVYTIKVYENGALRKTINTVAVGALWLSCGQSNMEYKLDWEANGQAEINNANDTNIRIFYVPSDPTGNPFGPHPGIPQDDIAGAFWGVGNNKSQLKDVSAMAYYAAKEMRAQLNMPIGIINAALGSSLIQSWLSRESIESNSAVKNALKNAGIYYNVEDYTTGTRDFTNMTSLYNVKIAPLAGMNIEGAFWCQGEGNVSFGPFDDGYYTEALKALSYTFSKAFGYKNNDIPLLVAHIANHPYHNPQSVALWIEDVLDACHQSGNIISVPVYDASQEVHPKDGSPTEGMYVPIHPWDKHLPGFRLGRTASHDIYKVNNKGVTVPFENSVIGNYYSPEVKAYKVQGNNIFVKFDHAGDRLTTLNGSADVLGFTIAGSNGIFANAKAEFISNDTIRIWNDAVRNPVNFTYAFNSFSVSCNLCNSYSIPAMPFRSNRNQSNYYNSNDWIHCDGTNVWVNEDGSGSYKPTWQKFILGPCESTVTVDKTNKCEGTGSIKLNYTPDSGNIAGVSARFNYYWQPSDFERFKNMSFKVKNNDNRQKTIQVIIGNSSQKWLVGKADGDPSFIIPANSGFVSCTVDLTKLTPWPSGTSTTLSNIENISILVIDNQSGSINIDEFSFGVDTPKAEIIGDTDDDTAVTAADALLTLQHTVELTKLNDHQKYISDVNGDGETNVLDALYILQNSVGLRPNFTKYSGMAEWLFK